MKIEAITLTNGPLRFSGHVCGEGELVILLHGFPDHAGTWRQHMEPLAAAGYRVLAMNMRGYEPSSQPDDADYQQTSIAQDVIAWLDELEVERAHLIGHDWGAAIAYFAAAAAPERFKSLITMTVPHPGRFLTQAVRFPKQVISSWYLLFFQLRGLSDWALRRNNYDFIRMLWRSWSPGWDIPQSHLDSVISHFSQPGVAKASLGYYRAALAPNTLAFTPSAIEAKAFPVPVPTLGLAGENDHCIRSEVFSELMRPGDFPAGLEVKVIPDAGHFAHLEQPERTTEIFLDWIKRHP